MRGGGCALCTRACVCVCRCVADGSQFSHRASVKPTTKQRHTYTRQSAQGVRRRRARLPAHAHTRTHAKQPKRMHTHTRTPCPFAARKEGGVGELTYPLVSDLKREIATAYGVLAPDGVALRGLFIIDKEVRACACVTCVLRACAARACVRVRPGLEPPPPPTRSPQTTHAPLPAAQQQYTHAHKHCVALPTNNNGTGRRPALYDQQPVVRPQRRRDAAHAAGAAVRAVQPGRGACRECAARVCVCVCVPCVCRVCAYVWRVAPLLSNLEATASVFHTQTHTRTHTRAHTDTHTHTAHTHARTPHTQTHGTRHTAHTHTRHTRRARHARDHRSAPPAGRRAPRR